MKIYLLHFERPVSGKRHYTGIAEDHRLNTRLQQHVRGHGASLTRRVAQANVRMFLVDVHDAPGFPDERRIKAARHAERRCSICNPKLVGKMQPQEIVNTLLPVPTPRPLLDWKL